MCRPADRAHVCAEASLHPGGDTLSAEPLDKTGTGMGEAQPISCRVPPGPGESMAHLVPVLQATLLASAPYPPRPGAAHLLPQPVAPVPRRAHGT